MSRADELQEELAKGVVGFGYKTAKGDARAAIGTMNPELITKLTAYKREGKLRKVLERCQRFMDTDTIADQRHSLEGEELSAEIEAILNPVNKSSTKKPSESVYRNYFDIEKMDFRKYSVDNLFD